MSGLSDEQRRRIEENKRKALEKRAMQQSGKIGQATTSVNKNVAPVGNPIYLASIGCYPMPSKTNSFSNMHQPVSSKKETLSPSLNIPVGSNDSSSRVTNTSVAASGSATSSVGVDNAKRIEENRRKALEKRAAQMRLQSGNSPSSPSKLQQNIRSESKNNEDWGPLKSNPIQPNPKPAADFYKSSSNSKTVNSSVNQSFQTCRNGANQSSFSNSNNSQKFGHNPTTSMFSKFGSNSNNSLSAVSDIPAVNAVLGQQGGKGGTSVSGAKPMFGKTVNGTFTLQSRERFIVDVGYHAQMIDVFKTMSTKLYDVETRKWNFDVSEHDALVAALNPLRPAVCISPLPLFVRKALKTSAQQMPSSCVDLFGLDPKLLDALLPFQHDGVCFGVSRNGRVLIADDMGLGKTIQALGIAAYYRREWPLLIVTPSSVRYSWMASIERWVGSVNKADIVVINSGKNCFEGAEVVITSYDMLSRRGKEYLNHKFGVVIMDESHMLKSFKTARYKAAAPIMKRAGRVILLSGTPALSRPSELFTQISAVDSNLFPSFQEFGVRYCAGKQHPWGWDFSGSSNMEELQIILNAKLMIRRLKSEVLEQLPSKRRSTVILDPNSVHSRSKALEAAAQQFGLKSLRGSEKHGALLTFFVESAHAKLNAVSEYIKELLESGNKFLVFAHHQVMMDKLTETCESVKCRYIRIDGKTSGEMRQNYVSKFQNCNDVRVAILSITAANTGLTLTAAQLVVFAELFWNPGALVQAEDRAHRIGQEDCVMVQYLVARGTIDDHIWPMIQAKLEVLSKVGLSKDNFSTADSTYQKETEQESILDYFDKITDIFPKDSVDEPELKKQKTEDKEQEPH